MSDVRDLTGERLFFRCGHERSPENSAPKGGGQVRCRLCKQERDRAQWAAIPQDKRTRHVEQTRKRRAEARAAAATEKREDAYGAAWRAFLANESEPPYFRLKAAVDAALKTAVSGRRRPA